MALIPPFFSDCVVAIGVPGGRGKPRWVASGFFFGEEIHNKAKGSNEKQYQVFLVTNKHVLKGNTLIYIRVNPAATGAARGYDVRLSDEAGQPIWVGHRQKDVDVALLRIDFNMLIDQGMQASFFASDQHSLSVDGMIESGMAEGDFAYVLGFPMGLVGEERNTVIVRGGTIARIRETLAKPTYRFLVDTTVFPGNSGGPVVSKPEVIAIEGTRAEARANLVGIVSAYVPYIDVAVSQQTGNPRVTFEENSGLAVVFSVDCIRQTVRRHQRQTGSQAGKATPKRSARASDDAEP
jgi:hypothetical protein